VSSRLTHIEHVFGGGWAPDYGAMAHVEIGKDGRCEIPWLMDAEDVEFEMDGSARKLYGYDNLYLVALEGGAAIRGLYDFWRQGTAGSPIQSRIVHVGTKVKMDDGDGAFSDVYTELYNGSIPHYSTFEGQVIIAQTGPDMPMYSNGVTHSTMSSPTPNFAFSESHKLRQWAAGVDAAPDYLFYSAQEDPTDWTGAGSGEIAISPGDGDRITAIASHRNELFVFKGPYKGSIHRISGSAPVGDDAFARNDFIPEGLGAVGQRTIFRFGNDLGFMWSDGSVHSLNTTEKYGDFLETALSRPLNRWLRDHVTHQSLSVASAVTLDSRGVVRFGIPLSGSGNPGIALSMDFRFDPVRWSKLVYVEDYCECFAVTYYPTGSSTQIMMSGTNDGRVRIWDTSAARGTALIRTPFLSYTNAPQRCTIYFGGARVSPKVAMDMTFNWVRDGHAEQSSTFLQWTGDVLAPAAAGATNFTLGTSAVAGERSITRSADLTDGGEFQQIQYGVTNTGAGNGLHLTAVLSSIKPGAVSMEVMT